VPSGNSFARTRKIRGGEVLGNINKLHLYEKGGGSVVDRDEGEMILTTKKEGVVDITHDTAMKKGKKGRDDLRPRGRRTRTKEDDQTSRREKRVGLPPERESCATQKWGRDRSLREKGKRRGRHRRR